MTMLVSLSTRIPKRTYLQLESLRHRLARKAGHRVLMQDLVRTALEAWVETQIEAK